MGSASKSSSLSGSAQKWAKPFAIQGANDVSSVYNANQPGINALTSQVQGLVPSTISKYQAGDPALNASENYSTGILGRDPYAGSSQLEQLIHSTGQHVTDQVGAAYGSRGSFGGTAWEQALAHGLASNESGLRYQDVQNNQQLQQQAAAGAPQQAAAQYLGISPVIAAATAGSTIPYQGINNQSSDLAALFNGQKQTSSTSLLGAALGAAGQAGGSYAASQSDRRLKDNIEKVGELEDGLGVYRWNYVWDSPEARHEGVMADEVERLRPWALGPLTDGFMTVVYGLLPDFPCMIEVS